MKKPEVTVEGVFQDRDVIRGAIVSQVINVPEQRGQVAQISESSGFECLGWLLCDVPVKVGDLVEVVIPFEDYGRITAVLPPQPTTVTAPNQNRWQKLFARRPAP
jgi:hypothetical protein